MVDQKLRAWWSHKQGLDGSLVGHSPAEVLTRTGWARSVAGAGPYLTLFARAGLGRAEIDSALARTEIHELPSARGCTYVLPAADYALGLKVGQSFREPEMKAARKLGVTEVEIDRLKAGILRALDRDTLDPDGLKDAVGDAARSLGPEGVKKGITTTLPVALGQLQAEGEIRRIPVNGRLDQQRYKYARWKPNPLAPWKLDVDTSFVELARHYYAWTGAASPAEFQWFSGLGVKAAKAALEPLRLVPFADDRLMLPEDREAFERFKIPRHPQYALVGSIDAINQLRRDLPSLLDPADTARVGAGQGLVDLPHHAIMDRGRLVGLWEFDPATSAIVRTSFIPPDAALREAVLRTEAFIREDLGDARSFSLDSPKSRAPRIEALRKAAAA